MITAFPCYLRGNALSNLWEPLWRGKNLKFQKYKCNLFICDVFICDFVLKWIGRFICTKIQNLTLLFSTQYLYFTNLFGQWPCECAKHIWHNSVHGYCIHRSTELKRIYVYLVLHWNAALSYSVWFVNVETFITYWKLFCWSPTKAGGKNFKVYEPSSPSPTTILISKWFCGTQHFWKAWVW